MIFIIYAERPFQYRSSPHSCDLFNLHQGKMVGDESGASRRSAPRGQTRGLIKARPSQPQTGFEVRHIKSTGSKVRHRTDLHLTLQLEMVISRCNDDPCLNVRDDTSVGDTRHLCERVRMSALTPPSINRGPRLALLWTCAREFLKKQTYHVISCFVK